MRMWERTKNRIMVDEQVELCRSMDISLITNSKHKRLFGRSREGPEKGETDSVQGCREAEKNEDWEVIDPTIKSSLVTFSRVMTSVTSSGFSS